MDATPNDRRVFLNEGSHESVIGITLRSSISASETASLAGDVDGVERPPFPDAGLVSVREQDVHAQAEEALLT